MVSKDYLLELATLRQVLEFCVKGPTLLPVFSKEQGQNQQDLKAFCPWWLCKVVSDLSILAACLQSACKSYINPCFWWLQATDLLSLPTRQTTAGKPKVLPQTTPSQHSNKMGAEHYLLKILGARTVSHWGIWCIHFEILGIEPKSKHGILLYFIQICLSSDQSLSGD